MWDQDILHISDNAKIKCKSKRGLRKNNWFSVGSMDLQASKNNQWRPSDLLNEVSNLKCWLFCRFLTDCLSFVQTFALRKRPSNCPFMVKWKCHTGGVLYRRFFLDQSDGGGDDTFVDFVHRSKVARGREETNPTSSQLHCKQLVLLKQSLRVLQSLFQEALEGCRRVWGGEIHSASGQSVSKCLVSAGRLRLK